MNKLKKELAAMMRAMPADDRGELLSFLNGEFCNQCGGETDEEGECCE